MLVRISPCLISLFLLFVSFDVFAAGATSPQSLGMGFVNAFRAKNVDAIVQLYYLDEDSTRQSWLKARWQVLMRDYELASYRVAELSGQERQQFQQKDMGDVRLFVLMPVKKLEFTLVGKSEMNVTLYIGIKSGFYYFLLRKLDDSKVNLAD